MTNVILIVQVEKTNKFEAMVTETIHQKILHFSDLNSNYLDTNKEEFLITMSIYAAEIKAHSAGDDALNDTSIFFRRLSEITKEDYLNDQTNEDFYRRLDKFLETYEKRAEVKEKSAAELVTEYFSRDSFSSIIEQGKGRN